jgi:hypothetical protein
MTPADSMLAAGLCDKSPFVAAEIGGLRAFPVLIESEREL